MPPIISASTTAIRPPISAQLGSALADALTVGELLPPVALWFVVVALVVAVATVVAVAVTVAVTVVPGFGVGVGPDPRLLESLPPVLSGMGGFVCEKLRDCWP